MEAGCRQRNPTFNELMYEPMIFRSCQDVGLVQFSIIDDLMSRCESRTTGAGDVRLKHGLTTD